MLVCLSSVLDWCCHELASAGIPRLDKQLNKVDFPTLGKPTIPICAGEGGYARAAVVRMWYRVVGSIDRWLDKLIVHRRNHLQYNQIRARCGRGQFSELDNPAWTTLHASHHDAGGDRQKVDVITFRCDLKRPK